MRLHSRFIQIYSLHNLEARVCFLTLIYVATDFFLGWLVIGFTLPDPSLTDIIYLGMNTVVRELKDHITWMMENPAGMKFNSVLPNLWETSPSTKFIFG